MKQDFRLNTSLTREPIRDHLIEAFKLQSPNLLGPSGGRLPEGSEFSRDVGPCSLSVDGKRLGDLAIRTTSLPQFGREHATLGDSLELSASFTMACALRVRVVAPCVAPWPAVIRAA
jgi:hypothetical protein